MAGNNRKVQEVNAGSMADIAFLLLIFFLVATTMNKDYGINRVLPPYQEKQDEQQVKQRNLFLVFVNRSNEIMAGGEVIDLSQLRESAKDFLLNLANDEDLPEIEIKEIDLLGKVAVSKGVISLQNDRGTHYETYISVQNELTKVYNELRDEASQRYFQKKFNDLAKEQKDAIVAAVPISISEAEPRLTK